MKKIILTALILTSTALAETAFVSVNGMVCGFCAQAITKKVQALSEVEKVQVDLDQKKVTIDFKDGQSADDATIEKVITDAGYKVVSIQRS
jgi:mercuric ion binding protein